MISRDVMLACYEHAASWMALARWHQEQAAEATRLALAVIAWALAHPGIAPEMTVRELRRMAALGSATSLGSARPAIGQGDRGMECRQGAPLRRIRNGDCAR